MGVVGDIELKKAESSHQSNLVELRQCHYNSAFDSTSSSIGFLFAEPSSWSVDKAGVWGFISPNILAVNVLASKSRSGHSGTILLAPW